MNSSTLRENLVTSEHAKFEPGGMLAAWVCNKLSRNALGKGWLAHAESLPELSITARQTELHHGALV